MRECDSCSPSPLFTRCSRFHTTLSHGHKTILPPIKLLRVLLTCNNVRTLLKQQRAHFVSTDRLATPYLSLSCNNHVWPSSCTKPSVRWRLHTLSRQCNNPAGSTDSSQRPPGRFESACSRCPSQCCTDAAPFPSFDFSLAASSTSSHRQWLSHPACSPGRSSSRPCPT